MKLFALFLTFFVFSSNHYNFEKIPKNPLKKLKSNFIEAKIYFFFNNFKIWKSFSKSQEKERKKLAKIFKIPFSIKNRKKVP